MPTIKSRGVRGVRLRKLSGREPRWWIQATAKTPDDLVVRIRKPARVNTRKGAESELAAWKTDVERGAKRRAAGLTPFGHSI